MSTAVSELLKSLKRSSKKDDIPGHVIMELDKVCPLCGKKMKRYRPCCGNPHGYDGCGCGFKVTLTERDL